MTTRDLHPLLDALPDARVVVIGRRVEGDGQLAVWRAAAEGARAAYARWSAAPGPLRHAAYAAAEDQADAALEGLEQLSAPPVLALA